MLFAFLRKSWKKKNEWGYVSADLVNRLQTTSPKQKRLAMIANLLL